MICSKCKRNIPDDAVLCCYCGKKYIKEKRHDRANGTGSVYYDNSKKKWVAQIVSGRHYTEDMRLRFTYTRKYFSSRTDALQHVQDLKEEKRPDFSVAYYYNEYLMGKGSKISRNKQAGYKIAYNRLKPLWNTPVKDLTVSAMQAVIDASCDSYYPAKDVRTVLNAIFRHAVAADRTINPHLPDMLELPPLEETQVEPLTEEEQLKLWYAYDGGNMDAAIPLIMIYTGMMTGEIRKLTKDMIRLEDREIISEVGLKTKERKRKSVLLPDDILPVLEDVMSKSKTDKLYQMCERKFYKTYYNALEQAGITRKLTPYSCRHTTATVLAVHENVAPQILQRVMRWKSTRMADRYVTPSDTDARKAVNKI